MPHFIKAPGYSLAVWPVPSTREWYALILKNVLPSLGGILEYRKRNPARPSGGLLPKRQTISKPAKNRIS
jgi:hypothetical protein